MITIGLTGGMASGKSTAARRLHELGAQVIDADRLGHRAYAPGTPGFGKVVAAFGADMVAKDGAIDRRRLGAKVFGQPSELKRLTDIVWPEVRRLVGLEMDALRSADPRGIAVLEAAVMVEAGWQDGLDEIWVVVAAPETAIQRAMARDGLSVEAVRSRLDAQPSNAERMAKADVVVDNSTGLEALYDQVDAEWVRIRQAQRHPPAKAAS